MLCAGPAVDLLEDVFCPRLSVPAVEFVIPDQRVESRVPGTLIRSCFRFQPAAEMIDEPGFPASISRRLGPLVPELEQTLGVGEGAIFLCSPRCRKKENLGGNGFR